VSYHRIQQYLRVVIRRNYRRYKLFKHMFGKTATAYEQDLAEAPLLVEVFDDSTNGLGLAHDGRRLALSGCLKLYQYFIRP
jgi:hypothetical protein